MRAILLCGLMAAALSASAALAAPDPESAPVPPPAQPQAAGSFRQSCHNVRIADGVLTAECADATGADRVSSLPYTQCRGDIGNDNGVLMCSGAAATGGELAGAKPHSRPAPTPAP